MIFKNMDWRSHEIVAKGIADSFRVFAILAGGSLVVYSFSVLMKVALK